MNAAKHTIVIATRGSALALVQANYILARCRAAFPGEAFELRTFKTTGDNLLGASLTESGKSLPKGLFTKELETALLAGEADLAVHSLKDLPTELPAGLTLAAVSEREDVRDVLISSAAASSSGSSAIKSLPAGSTVATSSTRRKMQLLALRPDLRTVEIRGNVLTRLRKVSEQAALHATILAAAGLKRLGYRVTDDGRLEGKDVPAGLHAAFLSLDEMLPAPGQAALGIETRAKDARIAAICAKLNHSETFSAVTAEREFLHAMGGGCLAPIAAHGVVADGRVNLRAVWFPDSTARHTGGSASVTEAAPLGQRLANELQSK